MGDSVLLTSLFTLVAVIEAVLAIYILIADTKAIKNKSVAALLILFSVNNIAVIGMATTFTLESAQFYHWLLIATTYSIGPAIFLASLILLRPKVGLNGRVYSILVFAILLPFVVSIADYLGISEYVIGQSLFYQALDVATFSGGYISSSVLTGGILRSVFLFSLVGFSVLAMVYPSLLAAIRDRTNARSNSKLAWILFGAIFLSTIFAGLRVWLDPQIIVLGQNLAFTIGFAYVGLLSGEDELSIRKLPEAIGNWAMINKIRLIVATIALPAIVVSGVTAIAFFQDNLVNTIGRNLTTLANAEANNITQKLNTEINKIITLSNDPILADIIASREIKYLDLLETDRAQIIAAEETAWQTASDDSLLVSSTLASERNYSLVSFQELSPSHSTLIVTDQHGALLTATGRPESYDLSANEWWQSSSNESEGYVYLGSPQFDDTIGQFVIEIAVPINIPDFGSQVDGVLLSVFSLEELNSNLQDIEVGDTGGLSLYNQQGEWVPTEGDMTQQDPRINWEILIDNQFGWQTTQYSGVDSVVGWADTFDSDMQNFIEMRVVAFIPIEEALTSVQSARNAGLIAIMILVVAAAGATYVLASFITKPLYNLTQTAQHILSGETGIVAEVSGNDEIGTLASTFNSMTTQLTTLVAGLEEIVSGRTKDLERQAVQMETAAEVAREAASIRDVNELLDQVTNLISERFGYYHTGIFLLDEPKEHAVLHSANSEGGKRMLARGHKLQVGKVGVVGYSAGEGEPRIAQDVGADVIYYDNPDMPDTRSEMALPLMIRNQVIGVLDVQSEDSNAFLKEDVQVLQTLADQIALAIENARLLKSSQDALNELEYLYGREIAQSWRKRIEKRSSVYTYTPSGVSQAASGEENGNEAENQLKKDIVFRGQTIGSIDLIRDSDQRPWSEDEKTLVDEIIEQTALALENARLSEQIRLRSDQIQLLQEVTSLATSTLDQSKLLDASAKKILTGLDLLNCNIVIFEGDQKSSTMMANAFSPKSDVIAAFTFDSSKTLNNEFTLEVIRTKKAAFFYDIQNDGRAKEVLGKLVPQVANSLMVTPLVVRDEVIGTINMSIDDKERKWDADDLVLLDQIGAQIAGAIDVINLFEAEQEARQAATARAQRESLVAEITTKVRTSNNPQDIIQTAIKELRQALAPEKGKKKSTISKVDNQASMTNGNQEEYLKEEKK